MGQLISAGLFFLLLSRLVNTSVKVNLRTFTELFYCHKSPFHRLDRDGFVFFGFTPFLFEMFKSYPK
jgi:hypothetical protein